MTGQRLFGFSVVLSLATACVPAMNQSVAPARGPDARIYANFSGGIANRMAQARFSVGSDAYVMVGHLGGDGFVRILYPSTPLHLGTLTKGKTYATADVYAVHDAIPSLYQAVTPRYRHASARLDSYDGAGNGYFFIIASQYPLHFDEIGAGDAFDLIEVPDYYNTYDPRLTIKALGDLVSRGRPYTLKFATSFGTVDYSTFLDQRADCLALSFFTLGLTSYAYTPYHLFGSRSMRNAFNCASRYAGFTRPRYATYTTNVPTTTIVPTPTGTEPRGKIRPPWQRRVTPPPRTPRNASAYLPERVNTRREATRASERAEARARAREAHERFSRPAYSDGSSSSAPRASTASSAGSTRAAEPASTPRAQPSGEGGRSGAPSTEKKREP
jgi:hypothetical protein